MIKVEDKSKPIIDEMERYWALIYKLKRIIEAGKKLTEEEWWPLVAQVENFHADYQKRIGTECELRDIPDVGEELFKALVGVTSLTDVSREGEESIPEAEAVKMIEMAKLRAEELTAIKNRRKQ